MSEPTRMRVRFAKMNICDCGFPILSEHLPPTLDYEIDPTRTKEVVMFCGGCLKAIRCEWVYVYSRGKSNGGYLPRQIFEPVDQGKR